MTLNTVSLICTGKWQMYCDNKTRDLESSEPGRHHWRRIAAWRYSLFPVDGRLWTIMAETAASQSASNAYYISH